MLAQTATAPTTGTGTGTSPVGTAAAQTSVTFTISTSGALGSTQVLTTGIANLDFTLGTGSTCTGSPAAGTCTVKVAFTPRAPGLGIGAVELTNSSSAVIATALVYGTGTAALDAGNARVRKVFAATQYISTVVGNGGSGLDDNGPATSASLNQPIGLALDAANNLYVSDSGNNGLREVTASAYPLTFTSTQVTAPALKARRR